MSEPTLDERRLALEEAREAHEFELSRARLQLEQKQSGSYSTGAVSIIGSAIAVASAVITALISGLFDLQTSEQNNQTSLNLKAEEVRGELDIKRLEVNGQIEVQKLIAQADRDRQATEQKFQIILQATKGLPTETASENLKFFVDAGILDDPGGRIRALAEQGKAPDLPAPVTSQAASNPLLERLAALDSADEPRSQTRDAEPFLIKDGLVLAQGKWPVRHIETPNHSGTIDPKYIILHYTMGVGNGTIQMLTNNQFKASAHIVIRRDGRLVQLLPLDFKAWHVGRSRWGALSSLNGQSIGIELENWGRLVRRGDRWTTLTNTAIPAQEILEAPHKNNPEVVGWHRFTQPQLASLRALLKAMVANDPELIDILGHDDVSPGRKYDPGPALPIEDLREAIFNRREALPPPT